MGMEVAGRGEGTRMDEFGCGKRLEKETKMVFEEKKWMGEKLRGSLVSLGIAVQNPQPNEDPSCPKPSHFPGWVLLERFFCGVFLVERFSVGLFFPLWDGRLFFCHKTPISYSPASR